MTDAHTPSLLEFPCAFPIKTVGIADDDFDTFVATVVRPLGIHDSYLFALEVHPGES